MPLYFFTFNYKPDINLGSFGHLTNGNQLLEMLLLHSRVSLKLKCTLISAS